MSHETQEQSEGYPAAGLSLCAAVLYACSGAGTGHRAVYQRPGYGVPAS